MRISDSGTDNNYVHGHYIGTDVTGTVPLGNDGGGVSLSSGASGNSIGGTLSGVHNVISGNASDGIHTVDP